MAASSIRLSAFRVGGLKKIGGPAWNRTRLEDHAWLLRKPIRHRAAGSHTRACLRESIRLRPPAIAVNGQLSGAGKKRHAPLIMPNIAGRTLRRKSGLGQPFQH